MTMRNRVYYFLFLLIVGVGMGKRPFTILAHSELTKSKPASGAVLDETPSEIRLTFGEPLGDGSTFQLFGEDFQQIGSIAPVMDAQFPNQLVSTVPPLAVGTYTVQWQAVVNDGHSLSGSYSFSIVAQSGVGWWRITAVILGIILLMGGKKQIARSREQGVRKKKV